MTTISGRMECRNCGSTGFHRPGCASHIPAAEERYEQCRQAYARIGALSTADQSRFNFELCRRHPRIVSQVLDSLGETP